MKNFFERLKGLGGDVRDLKGIRLGAIGPKTAGRLKQFGLKVDAFPDEYRAEALADAVGEVKGTRVLLARAEEARDVLPKTLKQRGAFVQVAPVYRTVKNRRIAGDVKKRLAERRSGCGDVYVLLHRARFHAAFQCPGTPAHF